MMIMDPMQMSRINTEKKEKQWNAIFPSEQKTEDDCLLFLSRMSYIAFAEYLMHREIVSPKVFKRRRIGDIIFHTFNKELRWGGKLSDMMRGIGEAVKMKYARQAFIMINEDDDDHDLATEVFTISFAYDEEDCLRITDESGNSVVSMGYKGKEAMRKQVSYLIQKITAISSGLKKFNNSVTPFIKITYYDERTPADYQPYAFQHCDTTYIFKCVPPRFEFGSLSTSFGASVIDIQSVYIENVANLEEATLQGYEQREIDFLDMTVDGDITLNDPSHIEMGEVHRSESLEIARDDNEEQKIYEQQMNQTYDVPDSERALQEELNSSSEPSPDTTNDDEYVAVQVKKKGSRKRAKKSPIKKSPLKRSVRVRQTKDVELEEGMDETLYQTMQSKVSKAYTSPDRPVVSPDRRQPTFGRFFKSSVVVRCVEKSPGDSTA